MNALLAAALAAVLSAPPWSVGDRDPASRPPAAAVPPSPAPAAEPGQDDDAPRTTVVDLRPTVIIRRFLYEGPFRRVSSVFCDQRSGEIYVLDSGKATIGIFDARGAPLFAFSDDEHLKDPLRLQVDASGRIYVLDADRSRIKVFSYRGEFQSDIDVAAIAKRAVTITAFALDSDGNLYVGDAAMGEILVLDHRRELKERFGSLGTGKGEFTSIASIAVDADRIYVADQVGLGVQVLSRHGRSQLGFGIHEMGKSNVSLPAGIAADPKGRFVLVDTLRHEIKYFEPGGQLIDIFGGVGEAPGEIAYPSDVSIGRDGIVCVADRGNNRVQALVPIEGSVPRQQAQQPSGGP